MFDDYDLKNLQKEKKKKTNSKAKGHRFERKIACMLNDKFETKEFSRTPGSGAFATTHSLPEYLKIYGDLIAPKSFKYCIECKKGYKGIKINHIFDYRSLLWKFIEQCENDSKKCDKSPMLILQQDRQPILALVKDELPKEEAIDHIKFNEYRIVLFSEILEKWDKGHWFNE